MLNWAKQFGIFCFLDNLHYEGRFNWILAAGARQRFQSNDLRAFDQWLRSTSGWKFGHIPYGLGRQLYQLPDKKSARVDFGPLHFFVPDILIRLEDETIIIEAEHSQAVFDAIEATEIPPPLPSSVRLQEGLHREAYISIIERLKAHIRRGDCYEINFCMEYFAEAADLDPVAAYHALSALSPNPLSGLYKLETNWLVCASPERFLRKQGSRVISQPIKGTERRGKDEAEDAFLAEKLRTSTKETAENVMVVDLVRNDLTRICEPASVHVPELFGIYAYPQVFQMISTVSGSLKPGFLPGRILAETFPMGSMTGAPKKRVLELIHQYEAADRGIFSGSIGYIDPRGDFDWNVVIRSLMYDEARKNLSYMVGSGITWYCDPVAEWEECQLKAMAIKKVLNA